jgi:Mn2+/Fe2+ NRAMP family transporter
MFGRGIGRGIAGNLKRHYPAPLVYVLVGLLVSANTINLGADLGAMVAALKLIISGPMLLYVALFAVVSVLRETFVRYSRYVSVLKWLTVSLLAYVGVVFVVGMPWTVRRQSFWDSERRHLREALARLVDDAMRLADDVASVALRWSVV